jgi:hypothetical protein
MFTATHTLSTKRLLALYRELGRAYASIVGEPARNRAERQLAFYWREIESRGCL